MTSAGSVGRHIVVFDCNVYLDIASLLGAPASWDSLADVAASEIESPVPHLSDPRIDSLRALAVCSSGKLIQGTALEVWSSLHIENIVRSKAMHPTEEDPVTGYKGLGWSESDADQMLDELIRRIIELSSGGSIDFQNYTDGDPPLDHEDGMVFGACRHLAGEDPLATVYCVTRDKGFLLAYEQKKLSPHTKVLSPSLFVSYVRAARASAAGAIMRPRPLAS